MTNEALRTLLSIAGWRGERARVVQITGGTDPILPTPFRIGETSAAALAAIDLAISDLWELRTGRRQEVAVDTRQATASLRSGHYLQMDGAPVSTERNTVMGVYPAKNGRWSYLHCNFPNHRAAALSVLGVPEDREAVRKAVMRWDALELEEAIIAANGAGGMVRTLEDWTRHPQAAAVASLPLMEIVKIGDSPPEKLPDGDRPLSGVRVLDLTRVLAGPTCARTLAEHGADVLKVTGAHLPSIGYQEYDTGHGKLSAHLDLREQKDLETLRGLVREADVFSQGYRPGSLDKRGLSPEALAQLRPGIVYVSLSAFSHVGPWASRRGFDTVVQTVSGITSRQGELFPGATPGPAILSGVGDRLSDRLSDGGRRAGGPRPPHARGRQLARAALSGADRALARQTRPGAGSRAQERAEGIHPRGAGALVDGERHAGRSAAPSRAGDTPLRDAAALGSALGSARLQRAGVAGPGHVGKPIVRTALLERVRLPTPGAGAPFGSEHLAALHR